jgi:hypothetical protein
VAYFLKWEFVKNIHLKESKVVFKRTEGDA